MDLLFEDGTNAIDEYRIEDTVATANNEFFSNEGLDVIDYSEQSPFSEKYRFDA